MDNKIMTRLVVTLLLMMVVGVSGVKAQDYDGIWYINNQKLPDDGYYFVPTINCFYNEDEDQPHLTTFKTGKDKNSIWRIVSVTVGTDTYYRIIHNATGKYLLANNAISGTDAHRKRVHLETLTTFDSNPSTDKSLFVLKELDADNKIVAIRSKNVVSGNHSYLNPKGNAATDFDSYSATDGRAIGNVNGIVGFYGNDTSNKPEDNAGSRWKLEIATSTCSNPVIKYIDSDTKIQISYPISSDTGWKIYYTTDGSDPSDATNSNRKETTANTTLTDLSEVTKVRAIATKTDWDPSEESVLIASGRTQLIQSKDCEAFYMVPPIVTSGDAVDPIYATTTNIPHAKMGWNFVPAGLYCGIQYYNIINAETNEYLYCNAGNGGDNALTMKASSDISSAEQIDRAKFRLLLQSDGSFKLISKWWAAEKPDKYLVTKKNGNNNAAVINLTNGADTKSSWNIIAPTDKKSISTVDKASTASDIKYIKIQSANTTGYYVIPPTTSGGNATASNAAASTSASNSNWYLIPATDGTDDNWVTYYNIRNGYTGEYLYFEGTAGAANTFFTSSEKTGDVERYKFIIVKGANAEAAYVNAYNIIPKALKDNANQANNSLNRNGTSLQTQNSRATPASLWNIVDGDYTVALPYINYNAATNKATISCTTVGATIYYTTDDSDPTDSNNPNRQSFTDPISFTDVTVVKAVASLNNQNSTIVTNVYVPAGSGSPYLFQNVECTDFYMIPGDVKSGNTEVNTSSLFRPTMSWYFSDAGSVDGVQYYYIINSSTGNYLFITGNNVYMKTSIVFDAATDKTSYMFTLVQGYSDDEKNNPDGFHIVPKSQISANNYCIYKGGWSNTTPPTIANSKDDVMKGSTDARRPEQKHTRWNFIAAPDNKLPASLTYDSTKPDDDNWPAFLSSSTATKYFKIENVGTAGRYMCPPTGTAVGTATTGDNELAWYVVEAGHDDWRKYYYIVHASTGKYLKFNQTISDPPSSMAGKNSVLSLLDYDNSASDRYQFVFAKSTIDEAYYIVPKGLEDATYNSYYALYLDGSNPIKSNKNRASDSYKWKFVAADLFCNNPVFEEKTVGEEKKISISCTTNAAKIYYTDNGETPDANSTLYEPESTTLLSAGQHLIKAIAVVSDGTVSSTSQSVTLLNKPVIALKEGESVVDENTYTYDGSAKTPTPSKVFIGTTETTAGFALASTDPYLNNTNAGTATVNVVDNDASDTWYIMNASTLFTINHAEATVTADYKTKVYQTTPSADPPLTATVTGMVNNEPETLINYTLSREPGDDVGSYTITPSGDGIQGNYQVTYETGVLQIGYEIHPTVTLADRVYGDPIVPSVSDNTGNGEVTYYYKTKDAADDTYTEEQPINVGNYTIKAEVSATPEYFAASATKDFSITKRSLTVVADAITKDYLDEDPELTYTVEGIQYNQERSDVLICELQRATGEDKGNYNITQKSLTLISTQNYKIPSFTGSTFTITAKNLGDPVTFEPAPKISIYAKKDGDNWIVKVYTGKTAFTENTDYTASVTGPDDNGNYIITVTAVENSNCSGVAKATYSASYTFYGIEGTTEKFTPYISTSSDLTTSSDLVPYIVTQVNSSIGTVSIVPISYIPKDEPVLLLAQETATGITTSPKNEATTPISESLISNNKLNIAPEGGVRVKATEAYIFYSYNENNKDIGEFVLTTAGTIKKGRYFLYNPKYNQEPSTDQGSAPKRSLAIVKGDSTGIIQLTNDEVKEGENAVWYTIDGQKLSKKPSRKGLYIQKGKKLIVK